jgi:transcriptional regulator with XRE-family HTH domain
MLHHLVKHADPARRYYGRVETMADRIRALRQARGMTQEQLADYCGVTKSAVSQWESGTTSNIRLQPLMRLVEALRTDHAFLIYGQHRKPDHELGPARKSRTAT